MLEKRVFSPIQSSDIKALGLKPPIRSHMFIKEKFDAGGKFEKVRARLVAGGDQQPRTVYDSTGTSSTTATVPFVLSIASIAAHEQRHVVASTVQKKKKWIFRLLRLR